MSDSQTKETVIYRQTKRKRQTTFRNSDGIAPYVLAASQKNQRTKPHQNTLQQYRAKKHKKEKRNGKERTELKFK